MSETLVEVVVAVCGTVFTSKKQTTMFYYISEFKKISIIAFIQFSQQWLIKILLINTCHNTFHGKCYIN